MSHPNQNGAERASWKQVGGELPQQWPQQQQQLPLKTVAAALTATTATSAAATATAAAAHPLQKQQTLETVRWTSSSRCLKIT